MGRNRKPASRARRIRPRLLLLLWIWAACVFVTLDLFLTVEEFDTVRPRARFYSAMRHAGHKLIGEPYAEGGRAPGRDRATAAVSRASRDAGVRQRAARWWAARLDGEREEFMAERGLDPSRPRATDPIDWRCVTFEEAKRMAAREGKPLLVTVAALWSPWCHRLDYYTFPDAELAALVAGRFIPVKILQEQDHGHDYLRLRNELKAEGVPVIGVWDAQGSLVKNVGGWAKPEELVARLREALQP